MSQEDYEELLRARAELAAIPVADIIANHAIGLQQLAVIHLIPDPGPDGSPTEPRLVEAGLAIDALGALVDALGDRLAPHHEALREAVTQLRLAFVEVVVPTVTSRIEQYALIGDTQTAAPRRRRRVDRLVVRAALRLRRLSSPRSSGTTATDAGSSHRRPADGRAAARTATARSSSRRSGTPPRAPSGSSTACRCGTRPSTSSGSSKACAAAVPMVMDFVVRFDYGSVVPWVYSTGDNIRFIAGPNGLCLTTPVHVEGRDFRHRAEFTVEAGDRVPFVLAGYPSYKEPPPRIDPHDAVARTTTFWQEWTAQSTYDGDWRDLVQRSLITLKALTFAPSGGIVAAPTTSLPEWIGGVRNWDYRYCWLRDATSRSTR